MNTRLLPAGHDVARDSDDVVLERRHVGSPSRDASKCISWLASGMQMVIASVMGSLSSMSSTSSVQLRPFSSKARPSTALTKSSAVMGRD